MILIDTRLQDIKTRSSELFALDKLTYLILHQF